MKNKQRLLKSLLSASLMGILTFGLLQTQLFARDNQYAPSRSENGSSVQIMPDGSKLIKHPDGTSVQVNPDGSKIIKEPDGTSIFVKPNGAKIIKKPDGTTIEVKPGQ